MRDAVVFRTAIQGRNDASILRDKFRWRLETVLDLAERLLCLTAPGRQNLVARQLGPIYTNRVKFTQHWWQL
jgi:hypothetical protein